MLMGLFEKLKEAYRRGNEEGKNFIMLDVLMKKPGELWNPKERRKIQEIAETYIHNKEKIKNYNLLEKISYRFGCGHY